MNDYDMKDYDIKNRFEYSGLNIPFFRIAMYVIRNVEKDEVMDLEQSKNFLYLQLKLVDKDAGFTHGESNVGVLINKNDFNEFKRDYEIWVNHHEKTVNETSFFAGERKQVEKMVKDIEDRLISTMKEQYQEMIGKQEEQSVSKINALIEKIELLSKNQEETFDKNKELFIQSAKQKKEFDKIQDSLQAFTDDLSDLEDENKELNASNEIKNLLNE